MRCRRIVAAITTHDRPESCCALLRQIKEMAPAEPALDYSVALVVFDDASPAPSRKRLLAHLQQTQTNGDCFRHFQHRHGRDGYGRLMTEVFTEVRQYDTDLFLFLQDDVRLCRSFFYYALRYWDSLPTVDRGALYLHRAAGTTDPDFKIWTDIAAEDLGDVERIGWIDCVGFLCDLVMLTALQWRVMPVASFTSSGVPAALSMMMAHHGLKIYRPKLSLVKHLDLPSKMHSELAPMQKQIRRTVDFLDDSLP